MLEWAGRGGYLLVSLFGVLLQLPPWFPLLGISHLLLSWRKEGMQISIGGCLRLRLWALGCLNSTSAFSCLSFFPVGCMGLMLTSLWLLLVFGQCRHMGTLVCAFLWSSVGGQAGSSSSQQFPPAGVNHLSATLDFSGYGSQATLPPKRRDVNHIDWVLWVAHWSPSLLGLRWGSTLLRGVFGANALVLFKESFNKILKKKKKISLAERSKSQGIIFHNFLCELCILICYHRWVP